MRLVEVVFRDDSTVRFGVKPDFDALQVFRRHDGFVRFRKIDGTHVLLTFDDLRFINVFDELGEESS